MAYGINGTLTNFRDPNGHGSTSLNRTRSYLGSYSFLNSVNDPLVHSIRWSGGLTEFEEPQASNYDSTTEKGDVVNIIFNIYQVNDYAYGPAFPGDYTLVASVRKSRDIPNISNADKYLGGDGVAVINYHTFTLDISEICKDLLSYSLVPHGQGTMTDFRYGGLSGGNRPQSNLALPVYLDNFSQKRNGCSRIIRVQMTAEILDGDGIIRNATASGSIKSSFDNYMIINNANDYDTTLSVGQNKGTGFLLHSGWGCSQTYPRQMATNTPNKTYTSSTSAKYRNLAKDIRMDENNEFMYWIQGTVNNYGIWNTPTGTGEVPYNGQNTSDLVDDVYMEVSAYDESGTFLRKGRLYDWNENLRPRETINGVSDCWLRTHNRYCTQNISPVFINANIIHDSSVNKRRWEDGGITYTRWRIDIDLAANNQQSLFLNDEVAYYRVSGTSVTTTQQNGQGIARGNFWEFRWYKIDREREIKTPVPITSSTAYSVYAGIYYTELRTDQLTNPDAVRYRGFRYNHIANPPYVRIYWVNKLGGIDAYTFKGNNTEGFVSSKDLILKRTPNRPDVGYGTNLSAYPNYYGGNNVPPQGLYKSDSYRGGDVYEGGREVLNTDATRIGTVTSRPLHQGKANWLREILTSPNVWTEYWMVEQGAGSQWVAGAIGNRSLSKVYLGSGGYMNDRHPSNRNYSPIIITSDEIETYNEQEGQVTISFDYMYSHPVNTQRN